MSDTKKLTDAQALRNLGVGDGASFDQVKAAYRKITSECHPDRLEESDPKRQSKIDLFKSASVAYAKLYERNAKGCWAESWEFSWSGDIKGGGESKAGPKVFGFVFEYLSQGKVDEVGRAFFGSFFRAGLTLLNASSGLSDGVNEMLGGYRDLFERYQLNELQLGRLKLQFLRGLWAQESQGLFNIAGLVCKQAKIVLDPRFRTSVAAVINPNTKAYKPMLSTESFDVFMSIATPAKGHCINDATLEFHRWAASEYGSEGCSESMEFGADRAGYPSMEDREPFLLALLKNKPALFGIYFEAGWFDFGHECYKDLGISPVEELMESKASGSDIAKALASIKGLREACRMVARLPEEQAKSGYQALASQMRMDKEALSMAPQRLLPEELLEEIVFDKAMGRALKDAKKNGLFQAFSGWTKKLAGGALGPADYALRAFQAAKCQNLEAFQGAISDWRANPGASVEDLRLSGVSLAGFVLALPESAADFKLAALGELAMRAGVSALRAKKYDKMARARTI